MQKASSFVNVANIIFMIFIIQHKRFKVFLFYAKSKTCSFIDKYQANLFYGIQSILASEIKSLIIFYSISNHIKFLSNH